MVHGFPCRNSNARLTDMNNPSRNLKVLIAEMSEDDLEFQGQLTNALYNGLKELKTQYVIGANSKDEEIIKQIRHKSKPTLPYRCLNLKR